MIILQFEGHLQLKYIHSTVRVR